MRRYILGLALLVTGEWTLANTLDSARDQFSANYKALSKSDAATLREQAAALKGYPLHPYLEYQALRKDLANTRQRDIDAFASSYADTPLPWQLNRQWLSHLHKTSQWQAYRDAYAKAPVEHALYDCRLQVARLNSGERNKALDEAARLWLVGHSQHDACDPLFTEWKKTGHPTSVEALKRFWLTVEKGNIGLAKFVERSIERPKEKRQTELFWRVRQHPEKVTELKAHHFTGTGYDTVLEYSFARWARKDRVTAAEAWIKQREKLGKKHAQTVSQINRSLALRLAVNYEDDAEKLISRIDNHYEHGDVTEWRIRVALAKQDWTTVRSHIAKLPSDLRDDEGWRYWDAIARSQLDGDTDISAALQPVSAERSYYGFLAAELNKAPYNLNRQAMQVEQTALDTLASIPGLLRARELYHHGLIIDANREWALVMDKLDKQQQLLAGYLALSWGWNNRAINTAISTRQWDELAIRFPQPHKELFALNADKQRIDQTWPMAIARQESAFLESARSHAGARGLMQLMPATAKRTARKHKVPYRRVSELNDPQLNIALGTAYLGDMYKRFGQNKAYATAAYNAGPHRVKRWLQERGHLPLDVWIETIPFKETRRYVQNVLAFRVIYERMAGRNGNMLSDNEEKQLALNLQPETNATKPL